jgi:hypothetical protein
VCELLYGVETKMSLQMEVKSKGKCLLSRGCLVFFLVSGMFCKFKHGVWIYGIVVPDLRC